MQSIEQLTENSDRLIEIESRMTASWWGLVGGEIEQKGERTHGQAQRVVTEGEESIRGLNGNGKNMVKILKERNQCIEKKLFLLIYRNSK